MHPDLLKLENSFQPSVLTQINEPLLEQYEIELWLKRDDLLHPIISGNKWRKLKYCLNQALRQNKTTLISMGGAYSNHLHALAYVGKELNLKTIGIVRGEQPKQLTPTLQDAIDWGMQLRFVSRTNYRQLHEYKHGQNVPNLTKEQYWIPEGGANNLALKGVAEIVAEITIPYNLLCVACGTGTTLAGLINTVPNSISVLGIAALNHADFLLSDVQQLINPTQTHWTINLDYHFGGFAKTNADLLNFIHEFEQTHRILLEPVYTGKMLYALYDLIKHQHIPKGQRIIALHTGGLQGRRGFLMTSDIT